MGLRYPYRMWLRHLMKGSDRVNKIPILNITDIKEDKIY